MKSSGKLPILINVIFLLILTCAAILAAKRFLPKKIEPNREAKETGSLCEVDSDCILGIKAKECCSCPQAINKNTVRKKGWEVYTKGKNYTPEKPEVCALVDCAACPPPGKVYCKDGKCSQLDLRPPEPSKYNCPPKEWLNCMPGPGYKKAMCTDKYIKWAKENCPKFKGVAY